MPNPEEGGLSEYRIFETTEFQKRLSKSTPKQQNLVENKLKQNVYPQLKTAPYHGPNIRKLQGYRPTTWRYRVGNYRVFYCVDESEQIVFLLTIDDRKDVYK